MHKGQQSDVALGGSRNRSIDYEEKKGNLLDFLEVFGMDEGETQKSELSCYLEVPYAPESIDILKR